ncbi:MAG: hypothetical protein IKE91_06820 [Clostridia bacterium]|nr:hypothetical protein [Clostridia bacterium]
MKEKLKKGTQNTLMFVLILLCFLAGCAAVLFVVWLVLRPILSYLI